MALLVGSCGVNRAPIDARYAQRVAQIHAKGDMLHRGNASFWRAQFAQLEPLRRQMIAVDAQGAPVQELSHTLRTALNRCDELPEPTTCRDVALQVHSQALLQRYSWADFQWATVEQQWTRNVELEVLLVRSHNARLAAAITEAEAPLRKGMLASRARIERLISTERALAAGEREDEVAEAREANRRRWQAVAAGLAAAGNGLQQPPTSSTSTSTYGAPRAPVNDYGTPTYQPPLATSTSTSAYETPRALEGGCHNDFQCGYGNVCVKNNYATSGTCMRAVNEYGTPTFQPPSTNSVLPKMPSPSDCQIATGCPIGFRCDMKSGTCISNR